MNVQKVWYLKSLPRDQLRDPAVVEELKRDLKRVWGEVSLLMANESFMEVLRLLAKADPKSAKKVEEIKEALLKITFYVLNL